MNLCTRMISPSIDVDSEFDSVRSLYSGLSSMFPTFRLSEGLDWKCAILCSAGASQDCLIKDVNSEYVEKAGDNIAHTSSTG